MTNTEWIEYYRLHPSDFENFIKFTEATINASDRRVKRLIEALEQTVFDMGNQGANRPNHALYVSYRAACAALINARPFLQQREMGNKAIGNLIEALEQITETAVTLGDSQSAWNEWRKCVAIAHLALAKASGERPEWTAEQILEREG